MFMNLLIIVLKKFGLEFFLALFSSFIFYLIVVYFPQKKSYYNSKTFLIEQYKNTKLDIINLILCEIEKDIYPYQEVKNNLDNFNYLRQIIDDADITKIRCFEEQKMKDFAKDIYYYLSQLQFFLSLELSKEYIQENKAAHERISSLIYFIKQFEHSMNTIELEREYDKYLRNDIQDFILGMNTVQGKKEFDDFIPIIEAAYSNQLLTTKFCNIFTALKLNI